MANIRIDVQYTITDGSEVSFTAPCDCTTVTGLKVYHLGGVKEFTFRDTHGNDLTGIGNLFESGAIVKALLDVTNGRAYLQNADTNAYLEAALASKAPAGDYATKDELNKKANLINAGVCDGDLNILGEGGVPINSVVWVTPETGNVPYGDWGYVETWRAQIGGEIQRYTSVNGVTYIRTRYHNGVILDWNSGWIRIDSLNSAPSGYGLGTTAKLIATRDEIDGCGFYRIDPTANDTPDAETWWGTVTRNSGTYYTFTASKYNGCTAQSVRTSAGWQPWEWVNPPMVANVPYRTRERHNGNPVYKKIDSGGIAWWSVDQNTWYTEAERHGAALAKVMVWETASRTSSFEPQTLSLDLSAYDEVLIYSCLEASQNNDYMVVSRCPVGERALAHFSWGDDGVSLHRFAKTSKTGIEFFNAYHGGAQDNASLMPYKIYGIKGG